MELQYYSFQSVFSVEAGRAVLQSVEERVFCYTTAAVEEALVRWGHKDTLLRFRGERVSLAGKYRRWSTAVTKDVVDRLFSQTLLTETDKVKALCEEKKCPVFVSLGERYSSPREGKEESIWGRWNPRLADYDFAKAVDPFTAHQEIAMFLGGLAWPDKTTNPIPDEIQRDEKGFDEWSFKRRGQKSAPRRP